MIFPIFALLSDKNDTTMWQRIQTLYLAIATVLIGSLFFSKFATIFGEGESTILYREYTPYLLFTIMTFLANLISLALFKARMIQMRLCIISAIVLLAFQIWIGVNYFFPPEEVENNIVFSFTAIFPVIAAILDVLAARNIMLDEAMVQSASRLRSARRKH